MSFRGGGDSRRLAPAGTGQSADDAVRGMRQRKTSFLSSLWHDWVAVA